jgi:hypothetical protein
MIDFEARLSTPLKRDNSVRARRSVTLIELKQVTPSMSIRAVAKVRNQSRRLDMYQTPHSAAA